jgi:hypothetical protein
MKLLQFALVTSLAGFAIASPTAKKLYGKVNETLEAYHPDVPTQTLDKRIDYNYCNPTVVPPPYIPCE